MGVIETIEYSVPVRKANGGIRICGDYKVTINQAVDIPEHPMPRVEELIQKLSGGKTFTKLDMSPVYQQIELDESAKPYVAINTHLGLYTFT